MNLAEDLLLLNWRDRQAASSVAGRAFAEYELLQHFFPNETEGQAIAETFSLIAISVCLKYGVVYASSEKLEGVSAWLPPGRAPFGGWQLIRSVPLSVLLRFGRQGAGRMQAYSRYMDNLHRKLVPYPHWYLQLLGVDPRYQGQGFSSRLVRPVLECIDRENLPCFVDTNTEKNVAIYERFGFKVISAEKVPQTEITCFAMLKNP